MNIQKYKYKGNSKYIVTIEDKDYTIYEDIIIKTNMLTKKDIKEKELLEILKENEFYEAYYSAIKYIDIKMRTKKEIINYLSKKNYDFNIEKVINKLEEEKYIDEKAYTKAYIFDVINLSMDGPLKIKKYLYDNNIDEDIIEKEIEAFDQNIIENKLKKLIEKQIKLNTNKSKLMLYEKIINNLSNKGYERKTIVDILEKYKIDDEEIMKKEYNKIYDKLKDKYEGKALEYKIKEKMYQKGFRNF